MTIKRRFVDAGVVTASAGIRATDKASVSLDGATQRARCAAGAALVQLVAVMSGTAAEHKQAA